MATWLEKFQFNASLFFFLLLINLDADVKRPNGGRVQDARFRIIVNY